MAAMSDRKHAPPIVVEPLRPRRFSNLPDRRLERRERPQSRGLSERDEADGGADQVGGEGVQEAERGRVLGDVLRPGERAEGNGVGDGTVEQRCAPNLRREHEGAALAERLRPPLPTGLRRLGQFGDGGKRLLVLGAVRMAQQDNVGPSGAETQDVLDPVA